MSTVRPLRRASVPTPRRRRARLDLACFLAACLAASCSRPDGRPSVVLITLDTTRADYLSCYGYPGSPHGKPGPSTPNLDRLAAEGTRFDLAIATAAVTPVSHASILTGRFNRDHGVRILMGGDGYRLPDDVPTLATEFAAAGYSTLAVHSAFPVSPHYGLTRDFERVESFTAQHEPGDGRRLDGEGGGIAAASRRSDESVDIVLSELRRARAPVFLWLHLWDPHDWHQLPPDEYLPDRREVAEAAGGAGSEAARMAWTIAVYEAEVRYMDAQLGRLFDGLDELGLFDTALIAVTSDHGQGLDDHDWPMHRILYQEQIRVPLIVRAPGSELVGSRSELVRTVDIAPTLLELAGLAPLEGIAGRSLVGLMRGEPESGRTAFADQVNGYDLSAGMVAKRPQDDFSYCVVDGGWKLVWRPNHPDRSELFHLAADPGELENLWAWEHAEARRLRELLAAHGPWVTEPFALPEADQGGGLARALESLGYVGDDAPRSGPEWQWVCTEDFEHREPELGRCEHCGRPLLLIGVDA